MKLINIRMEINEETELINKNNNVIKFLLQYNRANFEISKSKKKNNYSSQKLKFDVKNQDIDKIHLGTYDNRQIINNGNLLIKLKETIRNSKSNTKDSNKNRNENKNGKNTNYFLNKIFFII